MGISRCVVVVDGPPRLPEAPRGCPRLPEGAKSETPLGRFGPRGAEIELLCMFFDNVWMNMCHSQAKLILPRAIFRTIDSFLDPFIPKC